MSEFTDDLITEEAHPECLTLSSVKPFPGEPSHCLPFGHIPMPGICGPLSLKGQEPSPILSHTEETGADLAKQGERVASC